MIVLFAFNQAFAQSKLAVDEAMTQAFFRDNKLQILLMIESGSQQKNAKVHLEILSVNDTLLAEFEETTTIERGKNPLALNISYDPAKTSWDFMWLRLRYTISAAGEKQTGIISMSEIMPELYRIRASSSNNIYPGMNYIVRVKTFHPINEEQIIPNVKLDAELKIEVEKAKTGEDEDSENDELKIRATGETDANGVATLEFQIPADAKFNSKSYYNGNITIKGDKNGLKNNAYDSLRSLKEETTVYLNTDKPLYQPNQKIFIRGLALQNKFANASRKAVADKELEFKISDEENTVLYRQKVKTSKFGVASIEWQIPDNAKLGRYSVAVGEEENKNLGYSSFKVSRYKLPNFIVKTKTDKDFYLPKDKEAEVTINAVYLFGKDVAGGKIKIVQESERKWNYKTQKWDITEEETFEGEADKEGKFKQKIDLSETHEQLKNNDDDKFRDLNYSAYFTDSTTNITEQRRFDIRVSKEPIHVYLIGLKRYYDNDYNPKLPLEFYISTSSADGKPLETEVEIKGRYEGDDDKKFKTLTKVKTNKFGAAKVKFDPPKCEDNECDSEDLELKIIARDRDKIGTLENDDIDIDDDEKQIKIETDKTIYKKGDSMKVEISSSERNETVFVDVLRGYSSLSSHKVVLKNGRGKLTIPFDKNFKSNLKIAAYFDDDGEAVTDAKGIIFPTPKNLRLDVKTSKETYKPAEDATLDLAVASPDKTFGENAVGVFILDKAVEERALTDSNFGGGFNTFGEFQDLLGNARSFGGITQNDLEELDMSKSVSKDLQLAAEVMLKDSYGEPDYFSSYYQSNFGYIFREKLNWQFETTTKALRETYKKDFEHPTDVESFKKIISRNGIDFDSFVDPWGNKYRAYVYIDRGQDILYIWSDGANKKYDKENQVSSKDDFIALQMGFNYFPPEGLKIDKAVAEYYETTGKFVRDKETLRKVLIDKDFNLDNLKDRWGEPYNIIFGVEGRNYTIAFESAGPNKKLEEYGDDFIIWATRTDYFDKTQAKISAALSKYAKDKQQYPKTEAEFKQALKTGGIIFDDLRDGWGNPYYIESEITKRFADNVKIESIIEKQGDTPKERYVITPVTQEVVTFRVRSYGEKGKEEQSEWRKPRISQFAGVISEQTKDDAKPKIIVPKTILANGESAIFGTVKDPTGAVIPNAEIVLQNKVTKTEYTGKTGEDGTFLVEKLPAGLYELRASASGFQTTVVQSISITRENLSQIDVSLNVGDVATVVEVTASVDQVVNTSDASIGNNFSASQIQELPTNLRSVSNLLALQPGVTREGYVAGGRSNQSSIVLDGQELTDLRTENIQVVTKSGDESDPTATSQQRKETPRLRNYFPETLLWNPEVVTDANGKASVKFKLADNITTWKIYAIASDLYGKIGIAEKEIKAFQPFFVDLLPPRILTQGDEIFLPVQVRNYTESKQKVDVEMTKADWFSFLDSDKKQIEVDKNASQNAVFGYRADSIIDEGFQKVTAIADKDSDAIEKPVTVKPDGKEVVHTESEIFTNSVAFDVNFPANALPKTNEAEIKIYPNLFAHISESVEGLLKRPYGCGEQTISSTYPNLMILKLTRKDNKLRPIAQKYLQKGYERLLGYQVSDNGFSYWGGSDSANLALTAYALRFLSDASEFIDVDEDVINKTRNYLISQQREDGSWTQYYYGEQKVEDKRRTKQISTYIVRSLAKTERGKTDKNQTVQVALTKAFEYLEKRNAEIDEPYSLANLGLALLDAGEFEKADAVAKKLEEMAIAEGKTVYWNLETNTPFYGWGTAGRVETTALVVQLLTKIQGSKFKVQDSTADKLRPKTSELQTKGTMFLLKNKDRYGVWYSTQTTINVLDAFIATIGESDLESSKVKPVAEIFVNGNKVKDIELPPANELGFPLALRLDSSLLTNLNNSVEIKINGNRAAMMAQNVQNHYISWNDWTTSNTDTNQSRQIRLDYSCDKQNAKPTEEITCDVKAERIGFKGYGMLLAEIGIPPGADVDRASLEKAKDADWSFTRYDVLPDRIIVYMWSQAGGTDFKFKFKPRYGINAQTPASSVYDYYNEDAKAIIAPMRFAVK